MNKLMNTLVLLASLLLSATLPSYFAESQTASAGTTNLSTSDESLRQNTTAGGQTPVARAVVVAAPVSIPGCFCATRERERQDRFGGRMD